MHEIFEKLCEIKGITAYRFCKDTGVNASTISTWKKNKSLAGPDLAKKVCDYFNITYDYLMTGKEESDVKDTVLTIKDERDIKKSIDKIMTNIENRDGAPLYFDGIEVELTDDNKNLLRSALNIALSAVKIENKEKYNPNKNKKKDK